MKTVFEPTEAAEGVCPERIQRLGGLIQRHIDDGKLAGASVLIGRHGKTAHFKTFGMADIDKNMPVQPDTIFRIASMTKPVASVAVLQLIDEGSVLLNAPIEEYLPEFKDRKVLEKVPDSDGFRLVDPKSPVTIRRMLSHTCGQTFSDYMEGDDIVEVYRRFEAVQNWEACFNDVETLEQVTPRIAKTPLAFHPGEKWSYSYSNDVFGRLIEVVTGLEFDRYLRERLFDPLQMHDTDFRLTPAQTARVAEVYTYEMDENLKKKGDLKIHLQEFPNYQPAKLYLCGGVGLFSSITDYGRFCQMMLNGGELDGERVLSSRIVELARQNHIGDLDMFWGAGFKFGLGFDLHTDPGLSGSYKSVGAYGWGGILHTEFWIDPLKDMFVVMMSQLYPYDWEILNKLPQLVYQALLD